MAGLPDVLEAGRRVNGARVYNTSDWAKRLTSNPPQREERYRRGNNPMVCCVTGFTDPTQPRDRGYIFTHNEDYDRPLWWHPISRKTHRILHGRFTEPRKWFDLVAKHYVHGAWFTLLSMNPVRQWPGQGRTFFSIYPSGLPGPDELWPDYADQMGITREMFLSSDLRVPIRTLWKHEARR